YSVTITGVGFTSASAVTFGGTAAAYVIVSDTSISATAPPHTRGLVDIVVTVGGNTASHPFAYINTAPTGVNSQVSAPQNMWWTFGAGDFVFTDTEMDSLLAVKITTLPGLGSLTLNGAAVSAGQFISVSDINANKLKYTPP